MIIYCSIIYWMVGTYAPDIYLARVVCPCSILYAKCFTSFGLYLDLLIYKSGYYSFEGYMHHFVNWFLGTSSRMFVYMCAIYVMCTCMYACMYCMYVHTYLCMYIAMYACTYASRLMIVSREAKKKQRPLSELFTWTTTKKLGNAQAKPP